MKRDLFFFVLLMLLSALSGSRGSEEAEGVLANKIISGVATPTSITLQFNQNPNMWLKLILLKTNNCWSNTKHRINSGCLFTRWRHQLRKHHTTMCRKQANLNQIVILNFTNCTITVFMPLCVCACVCVCDVAHTRQEACYIKGLSVNQGTFTSCSNHSSWQALIRRTGRKKTPL